MPAVDYSASRRGQHRIYADDAWKDSSASVAETDDSAMVMSVLISLPQDTPSRNFTLTLFKCRITS